jgi:hypothetical protein
MAYTGESPIPEDDSYPQEIFGIGFVPDEGPSEPYVSDDFSFIPDETPLNHDPEVAFVPDMEPVQFNITEEPSFHAVDTVRCPKCKNMFDADISSDILCPHCGFSAPLRR